MRAILGILLSLFIVPILYAETYYGDPIFDQTRCFNLDGKVTTFKWENADLGGYRASMTVYLVPCGKNYILSGTKVAHREISDIGAVTQKGIFRTKKRGSYYFVVSATGYWEIARQRRKRNP